MAEGATSVKISTAVPWKIKDVELPYEFYLSILMKWEKTFLFLAIKSHFLSSKQNKTKYPKQFLQLRKKIESSGCHLKRLRTQI